MSENKPVAGQWYELDGERVWYVGRDYSGVAFVQRRNSLPEIMNDYDIACLQHLPDCTGWDWQEETFPQYWSATQIDYAFVRRDSETITHGVQKNGSEVCWETAWTKSCEFLRTRLTEAEALALLVRKPQPAEESEEWVEITDPEHVVRECDQVNVWKSPRESDWMTPDATLGVKVKRRPDCIFRCRRKDLPAKPKSKRTVTVPKWLVIDSSGKRVVFIQDEPPRTYGTVNTVEPAGFMEVEVG
jgi:hypothetical protein